MSNFADNPGEGAFAYWAQLGLALMFIVGPPVFVVLVATGALR